MYEEVTSTLQYLCSISASVVVSVVVVVCGIREVSRSNGAPGQRAGPAVVTRHSDQQRADGVGRPPVLDFDLQDQFDLA